MPIQLRLDGSEDLVDEKSKSKNKKSFIVYQYKVIVPQGVATRVNKRLLKFNKQLSNTLSENFREMIEFRLRGFKDSIRVEYHGKENVKK